MVQLNNSYARACKFSDDNSTQICACDFRINIYRCDQSEFFIGATWLMLILNVSVVFFSAIILYYLIKIKSQSIWLSSTRERGILRYLKFTLDSFKESLRYICNLSF